MKRLFLASPATLAFALCAPAAAQTGTPLFAGSDPIRLTLAAPLASLERDRERRFEVPGTLTDPSGAALPVSVELRGITRRKSDTCDFPPLRISFTSPPPATSVFAGQRRLKLVTHCRNAGGFQQHVLLEYAAYKMYNALTPKSFGARLANIDYRDGNRPVLSRVGFFIEDVTDVARRNGTSEVRGGERIPLAWITPADGARYSLFQHMLANHDWSMRAGPPGDTCCHNAKLIGSASDGQTVPVPYDFDYSGFVDAPYAEPPSQLSISSVRQRLYRGYCAHNPVAPAAARDMLARRPQVIAAITQTPGLTARSQGNAVAFIERFFADIATDAATASVLRKCVN